MNFLELLRALETRLGYHQVPLNPRARGIRDLFEGGPLHHELVVRLMRAIYARNKCQHLTDPVNREATFAALGPIRLEVLRAPHTDIDVYRLMDDLCLAVEQAFRESAGGASQPRVADKPVGARIIPFAPFLRMRQFKTPA